MPTATRQITRQEMAAKVYGSLCEIHDEWTQAPKGSFKERGVATKMDRAEHLHRLLEKGGIPSTQQVVAYFGAGARFAG
jgi:hypothetical protein